MPHASHTPSPLTLMTSLQAGFISPILQMMKLSHRDDVSCPLTEPVPPRLLQGISCRGGQGAGTEGRAPSPSLGLIFPNYKMRGHTHSLRLSPALKCGFKGDTC